MAWIESNQELWRHPKTKKLARLLKISIPTVIGHLHGLWYWAIDFAQTGDLEKYEPEDIADAVMWEGDAKEFVKALTDAEFLDVTESGKLVIHDWIDYAGRLIERREANKERMKKARADKKEDCAEHVQNTCVERDEHEQRTCRATVHNTTVPYPTVQNLNDVVVKGEKFINIDKDERTRAEIASAWGRDPSSTEIRKAISLMENLGDEVNPESLKLLAIALGICSERDACNVAFLTGIYNNFRDRGIKKVADYYDYETGRTK